MTHEEFRATLKDAVAQYEKLPEWQRKWMEADDWTNGGKCPPREPVNNNPYCPHCGRGGDDGY